MSKEKGKVGAIVLAGGHGSRMKSKIQKQYMFLEGKPLICHTLDAFERSVADEVILVTGMAEIAAVRREIVEVYGFEKVKAVVAGGAERYHSVYAGLRALTGCPWVLIHDGARPLVTKEIINRAAECARLYDACAVGMPVKDTIKIADASGYATETPDRRLLWQIQTPQAFSYDLIRRAYDEMMADERLQRGITDDAMVVESRTDRRVRLIEGSYENLKVTTPEDLVLASALLKARKERNAADGRELS